MQTQSFLTMRFTWLYRGLSADTIIPHNEIYIISRSQCRHNHSSQWDLHYIEVSVQTQSFLTMRFTLYRGLSADTIIPHDEIYIIISRSQCRHDALCKCQMFWRKYSCSKPVESLLSSYIGNNFHWNVTYTFWLHNNIQYNPKSPMANQKACFLINKQRPRMDSIEHDRGNHGSFLKQE